jgi:hypothetical protein
MKNIKNILVFISFCLVQMTVSAQPFSNGVYVIRLSNGKVLDAHAAQAYTNGGLVMLQDYNGGNNQHWRITWNGSSYKISCLLSGKVLDAYSSQTNLDGGRIMLQEDNGGNNQKWRVTTVTSGKVQIVCVQGGKVVDANAATMNDNGGKIMLHGANGGANQDWWFEKVSSATAMGNKLRIWVKSGDDDLRESFTILLHLKNGTNVRCSGEIASVGSGESRQGDFTFLSGSSPRDIKKSDLQGITIQFDGAGDDFGEGGDNWDLAQIKIDFPANSGEMYRLYQNVSGSIFRFTENERNKFRIDF